MGKQCKRSYVIKYVERLPSSTKVCTKCNDPRPLSRFRRRCKNKNGKKEYWNMGECMECEKAYREIFYEDNLEFCRKRGRENARKHYPTNRIRQKEYRRNNYPKIKAYMTKYREDNKERIAEMHEPVARKWFEKNRDELSDTYVIQHMIQKSGLNREDILPYPELIETYRQNMKIKRLIIQNQTL